MKIPCKIHYCWFGKEKLPPSAIHCISTWKKFFPNYDIIEWNEDNFDVNCCRYTQEAYQKRKWAFVSDYARFKILYTEGGIYFDTDVEVIKKLDDIVENGPFMGCENSGTIAPGLGLAANPGLGLAANPGLELIKEILDKYERDRFVNLDGTYNQYTVVQRVTDLLREKGFNLNSVSVQNVGGMRIYPVDYFCPMDYTSGIVNITENTRTIHHFTASWKGDSENRFVELRRKYYSRLINYPPVLAYNLATLLAMYKINGIAGIVRKIFRKGLRMIGLLHNDKDRRFDPKKKGDF